MPFYTRIALFSLAVALITSVVIWRGPQARDVTVVTRTPDGIDVPSGVAISVTFSRRVDPRSAEQQFVISPAVPGRFFWQDKKIMTFRPGRPLTPETTYQVTLRAGLRDEQGRVNEADISWPFTTRGPHLLALRSEQDGSSTLWLAAPDGSAPRKVYETATGITAVALAPDGIQAVLVEPRSPQRTALTLLNLNDGVARPLVDDPQISAGGPAWSPGGDLIAFERRAVLDNALGQPRIWLAQPDGTSLGPLYSGDDVNFAPVWSPDGSQIAFLDGISQTIGVYEQFSDKRRTLADMSGEPVNWLPDGSALVYSGATLADRGVRLRVRRLNLSSGATQNLTEDERAEYSPAISPDGAWIAFARRETNGPGSTLWVMRADGSQQRQLTSRGDYQDTLPAWSPDSRKISFVRNSTNGTLESAAWLLDLAGGEPRRVLDGAAQVVWVP